MVKIKRVVDGKELEFELTRKEIDEAYRQDKIETARGILANYEEDIANYDEVIENEDLMVEYADRLDEALNEDNGEVEQEVMEKVFALNEDY